MKTDGTARTKVSNESGFNITTSGDWIYYVTNVESGDSEIHKVKKDGTGLTMVAAATSIAYMCVSGEYLYFETSDLDGANGDIVRLKIDGTNNFMICDDTAEFINVSGDWIYYSNVSDANKLYKIKTDGTGKIKINDDDAMFINVVGDWIYYGIGTSDDTIKVKTDGTERQIFN